MKTHLLKSLLFIASMTLALYCSAQNEKVRVVYKYALQMHDSGPQKKEMKLLSVTKEFYDEKIFLNQSNDPLTVDLNGKVVLKKEQSHKDGDFNYQYLYGRKSATIKKIDKKNEDLLSITNIYFGVNNRLCDEITFDKKTNNKETKHYLYDRQNRLAKILLYNNGKVIAYTLYKYEYDSYNLNYTSL
jgi:hypothetical protein